MGHDSPPRATTCDPRPTTYDLRGAMASPLFADRYRIERRLGSGGMANVYLAHDVRVNAPVALKVLYAQHGSDPAYVARFHREAELAKSLHSPHVVRVLGSGQEGQ